MASALRLTVTSLNVDFPPLTLRKGLGVCNFHSERNSGIRYRFQRRSYLLHLPFLTYNSDLDKVILKILASPRLHYPEVIEGSMATFYSK